MIIYGYAMGIYTFILSLILMKCNNNLTAEGAFGRKRKQNEKKIEKPGKLMVY